MWFFPYLIFIYLFIFLKFFDKKATYCRQSTHARHLREKGLPSLLFKKKKTATKKKKKKIGK